MQTGQGSYRNMRKVHQQETRLMTSASHSKNIDLNKENKSSSNIINHDHSYKNMPKSASSIKTQKSAISKPESKKPNPFNYQTNLNETKNAVNQKKVTNISKQLDYVEETNNQIDYLHELNSVKLVEDKQLPYDTTDFVNKMEAKLHKQDIDQVGIETE